MADNRMYSNTYNIALEDLQKMSISGEVPCDSVKNIGTGFYHDPVVVRCTYKGMAETLNGCFDYTVLNFIDKYFGEIRAVAWNKQSKRMGEIIEIGQIYTLSSFLGYYQCVSGTMSRIQRPITIQIIPATKVTKQPNSNLFPILCPRYLSVTAFSEQLLVGTSTLYDVVGLLGEHNLRNIVNFKPIPTIIIMDEVGRKLFIDVSAKIKYFEQSTLRPFHTIFGFQGVRITSKSQRQACLQQDSLVNEIVDPDMLKHMQGSMHRGQGDVATEK